MVPTVLNRLLAQPDRGPAARASELRDDRTVRFRVTGFTPERSIVSRALRERCAMVTSVGNNSILRVNSFAWHEPGLD